LELLGKLPEKVPLEPEILEKTEFEDYIREKVVIQSQEDASVPAYVLKPKDCKNKHPAILCSHGHGYGKSDVCGIDEGDEIRQRWINEVNYDYAVQFTKRGFICIAPDLRPFGERRNGKDPFGGPTHQGRDPCNVNFLIGSLMGVNLLALNIWDMQRTIDYLQNRPDVDSERIAMVGLSYGGTMTLFTTALDERVKAAVISGYLNSWFDFPLEDWKICGSQILPNLLKFGDHTEIAALIAPRPLLIESGTRDPIFPIKTTLKTFRKLKRIYKLLGAEDSLDIDVFDGAHTFSGRKSLTWFTRWLVDRPD